jgi:hypothetical protein
MPKNIMAIEPRTDRFTPQRLTDSPIGTATRIESSPYIPVYRPTFVLLIFQAFLICAITGPKELISIESTEITRRRRLKGNIQVLLFVPSEDWPADIAV